jgi:hypothetical protein
MAGMENIQVHSKSYLVRWVNVTSGHTISWSVQPHKKSLNFGQSGVCKGWRER